MLVLSRLEGEDIMIGTDVRVTIVEVIHGRVRVGIEAPPDVRIDRREVFESRIAEQVAAARRGSLPLQAPPVDRTANGQGLVSRPALHSLVVEATAVEGSPVAERRRCKIATVRLTLEEHRAVGQAARMIGCSMEQLFRLSTVAESRKIVDRIEPHGGEDVQGSCGG